MIAALEFGCHRILVKSYSLSTASSDGLCVQIGLGNVFYSVEITEQSFKFRPHCEWGPPTPHSPPHKSVSDATLVFCKSPEYFTVYLLSLSLLPAFCSSERRILPRGSSSFSNNSEQIRAKMNGHATSSGTRFLEILKWQIVSTRVLRHPFSPVFFHFRLQLQVPIASHSTRHQKTTLNVFPTDQHTSLGPSVSWAMWICHWFMIPQDDICHP